MLLFAATLSAQGTTLVGKIADASDASVLPGAHVFLMPANGGEEIDQITNDLGEFRFTNLKRGDYTLKVTFLGYTEFTQKVSITKQMTDLGLLKLEEAAYELGQVQVVGQASQATSKEDTVQFNAAAFTVNPDASAEDMLRKVPGVVVENGRVQSQGENVQEVLIDGKPFFGNDPAAALKNLPAEVIDKIQVFDRQSEQDAFSGFNSGQTTKTINIVTRVNMRDGVFGRVFGGYGSDDRYQAGGAVNRFKDDLRLTVLGQFNNINEQNFSSEDLVGVASGSRGGRGGGPGGFGGGRGGNNAGDFLVDQTPGIAQTNAFGLNYSDNWGKKIKASGSYFYNFTDNVAAQLIDREIINDRADFTQTYQENTDSETKNTNNRVNFRFDYSINPTNSLLIQTRLSWQNNDGVQATGSQTLGGSSLLNGNALDFLSNLDGLNLNNQILFRHRFPKAGRTVSFEVNTTNRNNNGESNLFSEYSFFGANPRTDTLDQFSRLNALGWTINSSVNYTEPLSEKASLQLTYNATIQQDDSDKSTFDYSPFDAAYSDLNTTLSNVFDSRLITQRAGLGYRGRTEKMQYSLTMNSQWAALDNAQTYPLAADFNRTFFNVLPFGYARYEFNKQKNIRLFMRGGTNAPSISQLQDVIDNSNPLALRTGNPDLKQAINYNTSIRYSATNPGKSTVFYAYISGTLNRNNITNQTLIASEDLDLGNDIILPRGGQLISPVNINGNWNIRSFVTWGAPVRALRSNANISLNASYQESPGLINNLRNLSKTASVGVGLTLSSNFSEKIDFTLSSRTNFNNAVNTLSTSSNTQFWNQISEGRVNIIFPGNIVLRSSVVNTFFKGLGEGFDQNFWLWNASIGKKFLKGDRGEVNLQVFDLLKQNTSIQRNVTELYIEDVQQVVLQQYFMLNFNYKLSNYTMKPEDNRPPGGMPWRRD